MMKEKPETKVCKYCKTEIPYNAKVCPQCRRKQGKGIVKWGILAILVLGVLAAVFGSDDDSEKNIEGRNNTKTEQSIIKDDTEKNIKKGIKGIEVNKEINSTENFNFSYEIKGKKVFLNSYSGKEKILEIEKSYTIDGKKYKTDLSEFQVNNDCVERLILKNGIKKVQNSIFNSSKIKELFIPKSMKTIYDDTLAYLSPDDGERIKIYYAGTQEEWLSIFSEYKRKTVKEAWNSTNNPEEKGGAVGKSLADKLNKWVGHEYDSSKFEYFFSAKPSDLR